MTINETLRNAQKKFGSILRRQISERLTSADLDQLTEAARALRSVMDHTEAGPTFDRAHSLIDEVGRVIRESSPARCRLKFEDGAYHRTCDVDLAHLRFGMSPGFIIRESECSICKEDPQDCEHVRGEFYDDEPCIRVIKRADLLEISMVERPAYPEARIQSTSISNGELRARFGPDFSVGKPVQCDKCLSNCQGLHYPMRVNSTNVDSTAFLSPNE